MIAYRLADFGAFMASGTRSGEERFEKRCLAASIRPDERNAAWTSAVRISWIAHIDLPLPGLFFLGRAPRRAAKMLSSRAAWDLARPK
jgi:hypothetical protein